MCGKDTRDGLYLNVVARDVRSISNLIEFGLLTIACTLDLR